MELTEKEKKSISAINEIAKAIRFRSIDGAIIIERIISNILVNYFGNEKIKETLEKHLFYDTLTFDQKINLFNSLNKKGAFGSNYNKELNSNLEIINKIRNLMAHSIIINERAFLKTYNGSEIMFRSFTSKKMETKIRFKIYDENEDIDNLVFSFKVLDIRIDRIIDWLKEVLININRMTM